jgi:hypothetical protein
MAIRKLSQYSMEGDTREEFMECLRIITPLWSQLCKNEFNVWILHSEPRKRRISIEKNDK